MIEDFRIGDWLIQPLQNSLSRHGTQVKVDPKAMQVLVRLAQNSGEIVTKEELIESVWEGAFVTDEVLTNAIWELRRALGDDAKNPKYIRTAPRKGYQLIADYRPAEDVQSETSSAHTKQETERVIVSVEGNDRVSISQQKDRLKIDVENGSSGERIHLDVPVRRPFLSLAGILVVVLALLVGLNVWGLRDRLFGGTSSPIESLAVLPLENLSGDPEQEYFAEGMTEALIADLAKIGALRIISRQSVMQFKGTDSPLPEIAQALSVDAVVIGSGASLRR